MHDDPLAHSSDHPHGGGAHLRPNPGGESHQLWTAVRKQWTDKGASQLAALFDGQLSLLARRHDTAAIELILFWLDALNEEDPVCALSVTDRLQKLLSRLNASGLARWVLTGLRLFTGQSVLMRSYFRLESPQAIAAWQGEASAGDLAKFQRPLALLLHGLTGVKVEVQARHQTLANANPLRPVLTPTHLLLPDDYTTLDGPDRYHLYRAAVAHAAAHLMFSQPALPSLTLKPMSVAVISALEDARVEQLLILRYPGVRTWFLECLRRSVRQALDFGALLSRMNLALADPQYQDDNYWVNKARALVQQKSGNLDDYSGWRTTGSILANDLGQMRVPFREGGYLVPEPYRDDNSYLWEFPVTNVPAPEPLELQVRSAPLTDAETVKVRPDEVNDSDKPLDEHIPQSMPDVEFGRYLYPEWDRKIALMRTDWCTVIEKPPTLAGNEVRRVRDGRTSSGFTVTLQRSRRLCPTRHIRRQWEGDDIDLNAAIEVMVDRRMDLSPDPRFFMRPGSEDVVTSTLILMDLSESTNDRIQGRQETVLDVEKAAALPLVQAVLRSGDRIAVHGFSSNTRSEVNYYRLLEFGAPLDNSATRRIQSVGGRYSTRMGAALRHAAARVARDNTAQPALLVITDGAPSDIDVHDSRYLIEDARMAVLESRRAGVRAYCVALDPEAGGYVRRIFGWNNYTVVDDPHHLPAHLTAAYIRLTKR